MPGTACSGAWTGLPEGEGSDVCRGNALRALNDAIDTGQVISDAVRYSQVPKHNLTHPQAGQEPLTLPRTLETRYWACIVPLEYPYTTFIILQSTSRDR